MVVVSIGMRLGYIPFSLIRVEDLSVGKP